MAYRVDIGLARARLRIQGTQAHLAHQALDPLAIHRVPLGLELVSKAARRRSGKPGTVSSQPQWTARVHMRWRAEVSRVMVPVAAGAEQARGRPLPRRREPARRAHRRRGHRFCDRANGPALRCPAFQGSQRSGRPPRAHGCLTPKLLARQRGRDSTVLSKISKMLMRGDVDAADGPRPQAGQRLRSRPLGGVPRVQPRLARRPSPRALTRWCVARGGGAAPGSSCRRGLVPIHATTPRVRAASRAVRRAIKRALSGR